MKINNSFIANKNICRKVRYIIARLISKTPYLLHKMPLRVYINSVYKSYTTSGITMQIRLHSGITMQIRLH